MRWEAYKSVEVNDQIAWERFSSSMLTGSQVAKPRESNYIVGLYCDWPILISCTGKFNTRSYYIGIYFAVLLALALHRHVEPCQQDKEKFLWRWDIQFLSKRQRECSLTNQAPWTMSTRQGEVSLRVGYTFFCQRDNENARWHTRHPKLSEGDKEKFLWGWDIHFFVNETTRMLVDIPGTLS